MTKPTREELREEQELLIYGEVMHRITADGKREFIPREQWNIQHKAALEAALEE